MDKNKSGSLHGHTKNHHFSKEYTAWSGMVQRCTNKNHSSYKNYGLRGITICERWLHSFKNFYEDMGERPDGDYSIERKDNNGNYEPSNCKWATRVEQMINKRVRYDSGTGHRGVFYSKRERRYTAQIKYNGLRETVSSIKTLEEAVKIRKELELKYWGEPS